MENALMNVFRKKEIRAVLLALLALISALLIAPWSKQAPFIDSTVESVDEKVDTVLSLTSALALASAGISAIPGDTATPLAEKLADFTEYFVAVLCVLYAEKFTAGMIGLASFRVLIPIACLMGLIYLATSDIEWRKRASKLLVFALVFYAAIPISISVSDMIYDQYAETVEETVSDAESFSDEASLYQKESEANEGSLIEEIVDKLSDTATRLAEEATEVMKKFVDALAVLIVTSCIIPLLVLFLIARLSKMLLGVDIDVKLPRKKVHMRGEL